MVDGAETEKARDEKLLVMPYGLAKIRVRMPQGHCNSSRVC